MHRLHHRFRSASRSLTAVAVILIGMVLSTDVAQGRIDPTSTVSVAAQDDDTISKATGGGTVFANPLPDRTVSSFGFNARRPVGYVPGGLGLAEGRLNYDRHRGGVGRHVNAPVVYMQSENDSPPTPNGTGGSATFIADCTIGSDDMSSRQCPSRGVCRGQLGLWREFRRLQDLLLLPRPAGSSAGP